MDEKNINALSKSNDENADDLIAKEIEKTDEVIAELERFLIQTNDALSKMGEQNVYLTPTHLAETNSAFNNSKNRLTVTVEKLRGGGGGICEWPEFWDSFSSSIDNNDQLWGVDKFAYMRRYLEGQAKSIIVDLSLTATNNECAIDLLKKRFEKSAIQRTHANDLIQLPAVVKERDTQRPRQLYDSYKARNRALKSLGVF